MDRGEGGNAMVTLLKAEADQVRRGFCPHCKTAAMRLGPRGALCRNVLCAVCLREYNVGPLVAEVIHEVCPADRAKEIYGITVPKSGDGRNFP